MLVCIRKLESGDAPAFKNLRLRALEFEPTSFASSLEEEAHLGLQEIEERFLNLWNSPYNLIFGCFLEKELVGMIGIYQQTAQKKSHKAVLWGLYVDSNQRHQGLGRKLLQTAITHVKTALPEIKRLELTVESTNERAQKLYLSLGFTCWGCEPEALKVEGIFYDENYFSIRL